MRKILAALAGGLLAVTLSAPAAHAGSAATPAQQVRHHSDHGRGDDDWDGGDDGHYSHHEDHCHGLVTRLLCWLV
jgi:hypothetical protein